MNIQEKLVQKINDVRIGMMEAIISRNEKIAQLIAFIDNRPDKMHGIMVCNNSLASALNGKVDYVCDGISDEVQINQALVTARALGNVPVYLLGSSFVTRDSINLYNGDIIIGAIKGTTITFDSGLSGSDLVMFKVYEQNPYVELKNLILHEGIKTKNDVDSLIKKLDETGNLYITMDNVTFYLDSATGLIANASQGTINNCKFKSAIPSKNGNGIDIKYPSYLTLLNPLFQGLNVGLKLEGYLTYTTVIAPSFISNTTPMSISGGSVNVIGGNINGQQFKNSGNSTITTPNTYVTVTHGLAFTPTAQQIRITPTNNLGNSVKYWISDIGATTFRINVDSDPGAGTATFSWKAEY